MKVVSEKFHPEQKYKPFCFLENNLTTYRVLIKFWSYDLKVGGLAIECLSHYPLFPGKVAGSTLEVAGFLAGRRSLMRTL